MKVWSRCNQSGYLHRFQIYLGKEACPSKNGIYFDIVDTLTRDLRGNNHQVYMDNLYSSVKLFLHLKRHHIEACGTIRANRKHIPNQIRKPTGKMDRGQHVTFQDLNNPFLTITAWKDTGKNPVKFLSTFSKPNVTTRCLRRIGARYEELPQPICASQYNKNYGFVDKFDLFRSSYKVGSNGKKAWKYIFNFCLDASLVNSYLLYVETSQRPKTVKRYDQFRFRLELGKSLVGNFSSRKRPLGPETPIPNPYAEHINVHMQAKRVRRCAYHKKVPGNNKPMETAYGCRLCNIFLCKNCHKPFHDQI